MQIVGEGGGAAFFDFYILQVFLILVLFLILFLVLFLSAFATPALSGAQSLRESDAGVDLEYHHLRLLPLIRPILGIQTRQRRERFPKHSPE